MRLTSCGLIGLIGATVLVQALRRSRLRRAGVVVGHDCGHDHGHGGRAQQGALSLGVGLLPCTGAVADAGNLSRP